MRVLCRKVSGGNKVSDSPGNMDSHCTSAPRPRLFEADQQRRASVLLDRIADGDADVGCGRHGRKLCASPRVEFLRQLHVAHAAPQNNRLLEQWMFRTQCAQLFETRLNICNEAGEEEEEEEEEVKGCDPN